MSARVPDGDLSRFSMLDLFRMEVEAQGGALTDGLLALERHRTDGNTGAIPDRLAALMRAAHSLKGAARMIGYEAAVRVAHAMEDCFVEAQAGRRVLDTTHVDVLLQGVDVLSHLAQASEADFAKGSSWGRSEADAYVSLLNRVVSGLAIPMTAPVGLAALGRGVAAAPPAAPSPSPVVASPPAESSDTASTDTSVTEVASSDAPSAARPATEDQTGATVRVDADQLTRLLGLAGESLVASRWVGTFAADLRHLKRTQSETVRLLTVAREAAAMAKSMDGSAETAVDALRAASVAATRAHDELARCINELDAFDRRSMAVATRMYNQVLASRMRPFGDGVRGLPRMVRDMARTLGKQVRLDIVGESTPVDRDIIQRLEAPLVHALRNALDHGIEAPGDRIAAGKPAEGTVIIDARHRAGRLIVTVSDDGHGIVLETIRETVIERKLAPADVARQLSDAELLEFLFLPGFSTKHDVTDMSGRGVGLDAVRVAVREVGGTVEVASEPGVGMRLHMQLPLTLSVVRALLMEIGGEPYAMPLTRVTRVLKLPHSAVHSAEGRQYVMVDDQSVGLVPAHGVLEVAGASESETLSVVIVGDRGARYGFVVDKFLGERELVVRQLDPRLGKVRDVSAAAVLPDGAPVLILDVDDLVRSIELVVSGGRLASIAPKSGTVAARRRHRVLVVDDSITVRETERKLLEGAGYDVDVAVDGMDAWNAVRSGSYDLVVTDVDMPRLDGIELTVLIRKDARLHAMPIMIVSYKDREEDRLRGMDAGADYYLTKASFHDDTLLRAAVDLIGSGYE